MRTRVVEVRKAVIDGIKTALNDPKVSVTYAWQGADTTRHREQVFTDRVSATHEPTSLRAGRNYRDERLTFNVVILVVGAGQKPEDVDERALAIGQVVEEFIADHKSNQLGIPGLNWIRMDAMELSNRIGSDGSLSEITYTVVYYARLT